MKHETTGYGTYHFYCRYCDHMIAGWSIVYDTISDKLNMIEKDAIVHLMQCQRFYDLRKEEINEEV